MAMRCVAVILIGLLVVGTTGCFSNSKRRRVEAATGSDMKAMRDDIDRLRVEVEALGTEMERSDTAWRRELATVRGSIKGLEGKIGGTVSRAKQELAGKINDIERKRIGDKNALNVRMDAIVKKMGEAHGGRRTPSGPARTEQGFYHTVKPGETVSAIASKYRAEYGATIKAILEANNLTPKTIIQPGDKLFVPITK